MTNKLFVGGLPYETTQAELERLFADCGKVLSVKLIMDRDTGRSKGFGFVEMSNAEEASAAMAKLNGSTVGQRKIFVNEARPMEKRPGGFAPKPGSGGRRPGGGERPGSKGGFGAEKTWTDSPGGGAKRGGRGRKWGGKPGGGKSWDDGGRKRGGKRRDPGDGGGWGG